MVISMTLSRLILWSLRQRLIDADRILLRTEVRRCACLSLFLFDGLGRGTLTGGYILRVKNANEFGRFHKIYYFCRVKRK